MLLIFIAKFEEFRFKMLARILEHPFMRFLGAIFWGFLCFILWINFIIFPFSLYMFFDGGWLLTVGVIAIYSLALLLIRAFLTERLLFWFVYGFFLLSGGFLGLVFVGTPLNVRLDHRCSFITVWHRAEIYQHSETKDAVIYWRKKGSLLYQQKELPKESWDPEFTAPDIDGNLEITCLQDYRRLIN